jgi:heparan-alpha-glucosaminide N-acetyltransferase
VNTILQSPSTEQSTPTVFAPRIVSIDVFRGLTMAVMIFVNQLSSAHGLPWWTYHAPGNVDVMTYVDMVFPFFLFLVGMSLPISVERRLKRNASLFALWQHVILRVLSLIVLGLILANAEKADAQRMGFSGSVWALLGITSAALYLNVYVKSVRYSSFFNILRLLGISGVIVLFVLYRRTDPSGHTAWIDGSYPEILGLIGYSYLAAALLYIPTRRWAWAPPVWFALLMLLCALSTGKLMAFPGHIPLYFWPFDNGAMAAIVMAGVITTSIFLGKERRPSPRNAMSRAIAFSLLTLAAGAALTPLGISKIRATPTWSLYSIGSAVLVFTLLYWICDVKQWQRWARFLLPAGSNPLLTYLLPDLLFFLLLSLAFPYLDTLWNAGWPAVIKTLLFSLSILGVAGALTRSGIRLQL